MKVKVFEPKLAGSSLTFSPLPLSRLTRGESGLDLHHRDAGETPFEELRFVSAFSTAQQGHQEPQLLLFLKGQRRPFLIDANKISFAEFPLERSATVVPQLRDFLLFLYRVNPLIAVDRGTYEFLLGRSPAVLEREVGALATSLGLTLNDLDAA